MKRHSAFSWTPFAAGAIAALVTRSITDSSVVALLVAVAIGLVLAGLLVASGRRRARPDA